MRWTHTKLPGTRGGTLLTALAVVASLLVTVPSANAEEALTTLARTEVLSEIDSRQRLFEGTVRAYYGERGELDGLPAFGSTELSRDYNSANEAAVGLLSDFRYSGIESELLSRIADLYPLPDGYERIMAGTVDGIALLDMSASVDEVHVHLSFLSRDDLGDRTAIGSVHLWHSCRRNRTGGRPSVLLHGTLVRHRHPPGRVRGSSVVRVGGLRQWHRHGIRRRALL